MKSKRRAVEINTTTTITTTRKRDRERESDSDTPAKSGRKQAEQRKETQNPYTYYYKRINDLKPIRKEKTR